VFDRSALDSPACIQLGSPFDYTRFGKTVVQERDRRSKYGSAVFI